jgi:hypothetical protein
MVNNSIKIILYLIISLLFTACFQAPKYSDTPEISFKGFEYSGNTVQEGENLILNLDFKDGDGNLGLINSEDTSRNFFITLHSQNFVISDTFSIPNIPKIGSVAAISGTIRFNMISYFPTICNPFNTNTYDTSYFEIFVKDRSNNRSNTITTNNIVFQCR